ncbi:dGTPase [Halarcobacter ebronensis]|uniref:dGTPase n=1 Tax=Halarcobacter ebronensis TaxID=1462615 RepID=A0A4Q0YIK0_9BACT|nr:dGTPase [Halarcobacter ebronensis]RXJ70115.1 dGTPase [Halarcobacter ebronensis]
MIDYKKKIKLDREFYAFDKIDMSVESDRGRILSAPSLRRLQKKTQVFPLELNAAVRSRLTHSLEVSQTARFIAKTILSKCNKEFGLEELENAFVSIAEMTSLLHDIGNPPFGHFAEVAINNWMSTKGVELLNELVSVSESNLEFKEMLLKDLCSFDGNAQGIRIVTKLQRLNLSYSQIASIIKYTRGAFEEKPKKDDSLGYLKKKPGFYYSEREIIEKIKDSLDMKDGHRFPITYIMEAADDISYLNADMEDAVDKKILKFEDVYTLIKQECETMGETYLLELVEKFYNKAKQNEQEPYQFNLFLTLTRAKLTHALVEHVSKIYLDNHKEIFEGSFNSALLEYDKESKYTKAVKVLQNISIKYIYNYKDIQTLELKGHKILSSLFEKYTPLLKLHCSEFEKLVKAEKISCFLSQRLIRRLSSKHIVAYKDAVEGLNKEDKERFELEEWYYRVRLLIDYISGMTDDFALNEYKTLEALI